jgi:L-asparaginase
MPPCKTGGIAAERAGMRKKVCILYTGGTIGMVRTARGYAPQRGYLRRVLSSISELCNSGMPEWELLEFETLYDSSNIAAPEWNRIADMISEKYADFDGFVILHGTDTMAYTASALSFMLEGLDKPVILTGAQIPIGEVRSDARENLITSVILAGEGRCPEVGLYFSGKLLRGCRATKLSSEELAAFASPNCPALVTADIGIHYNTPFLRPPGDGLRAARISDEFPIAVLKIFPGIQFRLFEGILTEQLKGLVLEAFGVGNIPQRDESLIPLIRKAATNGTVITVCTQCLRGGVQLGAYETSSALQAAGAVSGFDMTVEAAVTKLRYLFSRGYDRETVCALMETDLRGELTK